jgi:hypothetical protein
MTWLPVNGQLSEKLTFKNVLSKLRATLRSHAKDQEHFNPESLLKGEDGNKLAIGANQRA